MWFKNYTLHLLVQHSTPWFTIGGNQSFRCLGKSPWWTTHKSTGTITFRRSPRLCFCSSGQWTALWRWTARWRSFKSLWRSWCICLFIFFPFFMKLVYLGVFCFIVKHLRLIIVWVFWGVDVQQVKPGRRSCWHVCQGSCVIRSQTIILEKRWHAGAALPSSISSPSTCSAPSWYTHALSTLPFDFVLIVIITIIILFIILHVLLQAFEFIKDIIRYGSLFPPQNHFIYLFFHCKLFS